MDLRTIALALGLDAEGLPDRAVTSAVSDSRKAGAGALFCCVPGERVDGHDYAAGACEAGACAVLAQREPVGLKDHFPDVPVFVVPDSIQGLGKIARAWRDSFKGRVIGLTGTAGKTTTREWLSSVLALTGKVASTAGNFNNQLGLPLSMLEAGGDEQYWVFECGISRPGDMEELGAILHPDLAIVLNAGEGHCEGLGEKGTAWHKTRLFEALTQGGLALASADYMDLVQEARAVFPGTAFFSVQGRTSPAFGAEPDCLVMPAEAGNGFHVRLRAGDSVRELDARLPLEGTAAAENLACVALACALLGVDPALIEEGVQKASVPGHRYRRVLTKSALIIDDTYNANPLSMSRSLSSAAAEAGRRQGPLVCVLGEMGELGSAAAKAHLELGRELKQAAPAHVFWKGGHAFDVARGLENAAPFTVFTSDEELAGLLADLAAAPPQGLTMLFKGSRSNRLETAAALGQTLFSDGDD